MGPHPFVHARGRPADRRFVMSVILEKSTTSALVLFSGGQDSATCLAWALERFGRVETVGFDYGQRHLVEMEARQAVRAGMKTALPQWADRLGDDHVVDLTGYGRIAESALTADRKIEMDARGLPTTFVPGRNLIFLVAAAGLLLSAAVLAAMEERPLRARGSGQV